MGMGMGMGMHWGWILVWILCRGTASARSTYYMKTDFVLEEEACTIGLLTSLQVIKQGRRIVQIAWQGVFYISTRYIGSNQALGNTETSQQSTWRSEDSILLFSFFSSSPACILGPLSGAICRKEIEQLLVSAMCLEVYSTGWLSTS